MAQSEEIHVEPRKLPEEGLSKEEDIEETENLALGPVRRGAQQFFRRVDHAYTMQSPSSDEFKRSCYVGKQTHEQRTLNDIMAKYLKKIDMSLRDGKKVHECVYWWRHGALPMNDILQAFEYYLNDKLADDFESCRCSMLVATKVNVENMIRERLTKSGRL